MKHLLLALTLSFTPNILFASIDAVAEVSSVELTMNDNFSKQPASILVKYIPFQGHKKKILSITVNWRGSKVVIPKEEFEGLTKLQIDKMQLKYGAYRDGRKYYYIDTLYGDPEKTSENGFKQVWLLMQGNAFIERKTFITLRLDKSTSHFKQLAHKLKGKAETATEK